MKRYFENCVTVEEVKARFRDLAKQLHPDCGGDAQAFREMMEQYRTVFERYKDTHRASNGETYHKASNETPDEFADIINAMMGFDGVMIEIIGSWIWVSGNTYSYREQIKALGFFWSKSKRAWYYNGSTEKTTKRGHYNMDGLRAMWGTTVVENENGTRKIG